MDLFSALAVGPKILAEPAGIVRNQRIRSLKDGAGRAVVLLQAIELRRREIAAELLHVLHARAAPAIDRLIIVKHRKWKSLAAHKETHPGVLDGIRVLKLINHHVTEAAPIMREHLRPFAPQLEGAQQKLREIDDACLCAGGLVGRVEFDELAARGVAAVLQHRRTATFILVRVDEPLDFPRDPARFVELLGFQDLPDEARLVFGIENLETLRQIGLAPMDAQQAVRDAMERADPQSRTGHAEELLDAAAHLPGRLVRERDGKNTLRGCAFDLNQPGDSMREHAGLAAAGARQHQHGPKRRRNRCALRVVQRIEEG